MRAMVGGLASIRSSASSTAKGSSPTAGRAQSTAWPSPSASGWRMKMQRQPAGSTERETCSSLGLCSSAASSSGLESKWSSIARLLRPVTKMRSVRPAAAASSTAYWMSGLSTMGSISFGLALVAGRNRLPRPATGKTALVIFRRAMSHLFYQVFEGIFIQDRYAQRLGLVQLAPGLGAGDHVISLLRHRAGNLVAARLDQAAGLVAAQARKGTSEHEGFRPLFRLDDRDALDLDRLRQAVDHVAVVRLVHELVHAFHHFRADAFERHRDRGFALALALGIVLARALLFLGLRAPVGIEQRLQRAEVAREDLRDLLAHARDAERVHEARQLDLARALDRVDDVLRRFLRHALQTRERPGGQAVQVGRAAHELFVHELVDELLAQPFDVHGAPAGEVKQSLLALRAAEEPAAAACRRLALEANHGRAALGAFLRHGEPVFRAPRAPLQDLDQLGDDVAGAPDHDRVADPHVLAPQFVLVVERDVGDRRATDEDRLQSRRGREHARAAHVHADAFHLGALLLRRELVRDGKARRARDVAELLLPIEPVHLVDHAVDREGQRRALAADLAEIAQQALDVLDPLPLLGDRETELLEPVEDLRLGGPARAARLAHAIGGKA